MAKKIAKKIGRPTEYNSDFHPQDFLTQSKQGMNVAQIARNWDISRQCFYEWTTKHEEFGDAFRKGREYCDAWYTDIGRAAMLNAATINGQKVKVDLGMFVWMTKNVCKWSDKVQTEISGSVQQNVSAVTEEKMKEILEKIRQEY